MTSPDSEPAAAPLSRVDSIVRDLMRDLHAENPHSAATSSVLAANRQIWADRPGPTGELYRDAIRIAARNWDQTARSASLPAGESDA